MREGGLPDCGPTRRAGRDACCGYKSKSVYEEPPVIQGDEIHVYGMAGSNSITDIVAERIHVVPYGADRSAFVDEQLTAATST